MICMLDDLEKALSDLVDEINKNITDSSVKLTMRVRNGTGIETNKDEKPVSVGLSKEITITELIKL